MSLGPKLSALLKEHGLEQKDLARKLKVAPSCVSDWVNGHTWPRRKTLAKLARTFNTTVAELMA